MPSNVFRTIIFLSVVTIAVYVSSGFYTRDSTMSTSNDTQSFAEMQKSMIVQGKDLAAWEKMLLGKKFGAAKQSGDETMYTPEGCGGQGREAEGIKVFVREILPRESRVISYGEAITEDYIQHRLNIDLSKDGRAEKMFSKQDLPNLNRVIWKPYYYTEDYKEKRVNVNLDEDGKAARVWFG